MLDCEPTPGWRLPYNHNSMSDSLALPPLALLRQKYPSRGLADVPAAARAAFAAAPWRARVKPGMSVGVAAGSRGIANYDTLVRLVCDHLKDLGAKPFIFPCMGSHGGATSAGQTAVLQESGITEATMGVAIRSEIVPTHLGQSPATGMEVYMDAHAHAADGFLLVNRIKPHTDFAGQLESGMMKMMAMGIGKHRGAQSYHAYAIRGDRYEAAIRAAASAVLATGKCLGGVMVLEDAFHQTARIETISPDELPGKEERLLALVKEWVPRLQVAEVDLLIIDEMGKNISGAGLDTKVINRSVHGDSNTWPTTIIQRIYVRDLTPQTKGNAVGIGLLEGISQRLFEKIEWTSTRVNTLTASTPRNARVPLTFPNDREGVVALLQTAGLLDIAHAKIAWIRNTLEVAHLAVSHNLRVELEAKIPCEVVQAELPWNFDTAGNLVSPF